MTSQARAFRALVGEAIGDGVRRRIVPLIVAVSLLSLLVVDSCTSCGTAQLTSNGRVVEIPEVGAWTGLVIFVVLGLWSIVLAGILGADHLAETLSDGSANLSLARPVRRSTFAFARLGGALAIAWATGGFLLGATAVILHGRYGVALLPALAAGLGFALSSFTVGALAMAASLALPRIATALLVLVGVFAIAGVNAGALAGAELGGVAALLDRFGPPLGSSLVVAVAPWIAPTQVPGDPTWLALRQLAWVGLAGAALVGSFGRIELGR